MIDGGEIGCEMGDFLEIFESADGEGGGGETVNAGVLGGAGFAFWGSRAVLLTALARLAASCFSVIGMKMDPLDSEVARGKRQLRYLAGQVVEKKGSYFFGTGVMKSTGDRKLAQRTFETPPNGVERDTVRGGTA